jgi:hypothetical protein
MMIIPCKYGDICPFGGKYLMWETERAFWATKKLIEAGFEVRCEGDEYRSVVFHVDDWDKVAAVVKPRTRRTLSPEHLEKLRKGRK